MAEVDSEGATGRAKRWLGLGGAVIGVAAAAVGLVFTLAPGLKPCIGGSAAEFTGTPVFPKVRFRDHLIREGATESQARTEPNLLGAEVRFSYRMDELRDTRLTITWSLVAIERDGTLGAVIPGQDRALAMNVTPSSCSETGGKDLFVQIPQPGRRYVVVLELYRDPRLSDRLALGQTAPFRG